MFDKWGFTYSYSQVLVSEPGERHAASRADDVQNIPVNWPVFEARTMFGITLTSGLQFVASIGSLNTSKVQSRIAKVRAQSLLHFLHKGFIKVELHGHKAMLAPLDHEYRYLPFK